MRSALLLSCKNVDDATELSRPLSGATKTNVRPLDRWTRKSSEPVVAGCCRLRSSLLFIGVASDARPLLCSLALSSVESHPTTKHFVRSCKGSETISYFLPPNFTFAFRSFVRSRPKHSSCDLHDRFVFLQSDRRTSSECKVDRNEMEI